MPYFHEYPAGHENRRSLPSVWLTAVDLWECECGHAQPTDTDDPCEECEADMPDDPVIIPSAWVCYSGLPGCLPDSDGPVTGYFKSPAAAMLEYLEDTDLPGDPDMIEALESGDYRNDPALPLLRRWIESA